MARRHGTEQVYDESLPSTSGATNNQMELEAPSVALDRALGGRTPLSLSHFKKIVVRTDSAHRGMRPSDHIGPATASRFR